VSLPRHLLFLLTALGVGSSLPADTLRLANGDVLHGHLLDHSHGEIRFLSPALGTLVLADSNASVELEADHGATHNSTSTPLSQTTLVKPKKQDAVTAQAVSAKPPHWDSKIESGLIWQSGRRDSTDLNLRGETSYKTATNDIRLQGRYLYSRSSVVTLTDRTDAGLRWRRELDSTWFAQTNTSYLSDRVKGIDHNTEENLGFGYRLIKSPRASASVGSGVTLQYRDAPNIDTGFSLLGELFQDFALKINKRLELGEEASALYSPSGRSLRTLANNQIVFIDTNAPNYRYGANAFLRGKLTDGFSLNLRYEFDFDSSVARPTQQTDERVTTSLGYSF
jgi:putative salt-induced outer membrane protein YdiY